jgi:sugar-specific transcriptional regulator TrmB
MGKFKVSHKIERALLQLGLTEKEIVIYVVLLEKGASSVQDLNRASGINRVTIYSALDMLMKKGLAAETKKGKRALFVAESPESFQRIINDERLFLEDKEETLNNLLLPSLKALSISEENRPVFKFYTGEKGIDQVYEDYMLKSEEILACGSWDPVMKFASWKDERWYLKEIERRKIFYRQILEDTAINQRFARVFKGIFHAKFLPKGVSAPADIQVMGNVTALLSYGKMTATVIEDEVIARSVKVMLEFMWEKL